MKSRTLIIVIGSLIALFVCLCLAGILFFETVGDSPEIQAIVTANAATAEAENALATAEAIAEPTRLAASRLLLEENFDNGETSLTISEPGEIGDGVYQARYLWAGGFSVVSTGLSPADFIAELECEMRGTGYNEECGFAFNTQYDGGGNLIGYYAIFLTDSGYGYIRSPLEGMSHSSFHSDSAIDSGVNHLRIERLGRWARVYINNQEVDRIELDEETLTTGEIALYTGLTGGAESTDTAALTIDNVRIWEVPE
jgi:hypothetical protein